MKQANVDKRKALRVDAEAMVAPILPKELMTHPNEELMHELLVHKVELEMQNEELRRAYIELEAARDRYVDLYEFSPVSYITVSRGAVISEINLTGAALLGVERAKLIGRRFSTFVAPQDMDRWHRLFMNVMEHAEVEKHTFDLQMIRADGSIFYAHLDGLRREHPDEPAVLRLAMLDVSRLKQTEEDLRLAATALAISQTPP